MVGNFSHIRPSWCEQKELIFLIVWMLFCSHQRRVLCEKSQSFLNTLYFKIVIIEFCTLNSNWHQLSLSKKKAILSIKLCTADKQATTIKSTKLTAFCARIQKIRSFGGVVAQSGKRLDENGFYHLLLTKIVWIFVSGSKMVVILHDGGFLIK